MIRFAGEFADAAAGALDLERLLGPNVVRLGGKSPRHGLIQVLMARVYTQPDRHGFVRHAYYVTRDFPLEIWVDRSEEMSEARALAPVLAQLLGDRVGVRLGDEKVLIFIGDPK
jgi:hypothetical protein